MTFGTASEIGVSLDIQSGPLPVGRLATRGGVIYFQYDQSFIERGPEISPIRLPLGPGLKTFDRVLFEGLPGAFNDSLPDGWGRLLLDRAIRREGIRPGQLGALDRLAHVGRRGVGALIYEPDHSARQEEAGVLDLDDLAAKTQAVLEGAADDVLQALIELNGSTAGARPKAMIALDETRKQVRHGGKAEAMFEPWLVKFPNTEDGEDAGAIEYVYSIMAKDAGVAMAETHLFPAKTGGGYFATKRFDRTKEGRLHTHTACGLLHSDFRTPSLDYEDLLTLTEYLTRDAREVEKMFRLAAFNVLAHNRDDHAKNFAFLMDGVGEWKLSPAYDLTFSFGPGGEQSTTIMGEGRAPGIEHLARLGEAAKIDPKTVRDVVTQTGSALSHWRTLADEHSVQKDSIDLIEQRLSLKET